MTHIEIPNKNFRWANHNEHEHTNKKREIEERTEQEERKRKKKHSTDTNDENESKEFFKIADTSMKLKWSVYYALLALLVCLTDGHTERAEKHPIAFSCPQNERNKKKKNEREEKQQRQQRRKWKTI